MTVIAFIFLIYIYLSPFILLGLGVAYVVGRRFNQRLIASVAGAIAGVSTLWGTLFAAIVLWLGPHNVSGDPSGWYPLAFSLAFFSVPVACVAALVAATGRAHGRRLGHP